MITQIFVTLTTFKSMNPKQYYNNDYNNTWIHFKYNHSYYKTLFIHISNHLNHARFFYYNINSTL